MKTPQPPPPDLQPRPGKVPLVVAANHRSSIADTAEYFDVEAKRINGWIFKNQLHGVLGNVAEGWCYAWSVERHLKRLANLIPREPG